MKYLVMLGRAGQQMEPSIKTADEIQEALPVILEPGTIRSIYRLRPGRDPEKVYLRQLGKYVWLADVYWNFIQDIV